MIKRMLDVPWNIIADLSQGDPLPRIWVVYLGGGGLAFGIVSIPSTGIAVGLIPMFIAAGILCLYGCFVMEYPGTEGIRSKKTVASGMALMILASWTRGIVVWGLGQHGAGSDILATAVWAWITIGACFLFISVWTRGLQ